MVSEKSLGFRTFGLGKKVSVLVSENLVSEKSFSFGKFGLKKSLGFGFGKLGIGKEKIKVTRKNLHQVNSPSLLFEFYSFFVLFLSIRWRKAKTATLTLTFYSGGEEKEGKYSEKENIFFFLEEKKTREGKGEKYLEKISQGH